MMFHNIYVDEESIELKEGNFFQQKKDFVERIHRIIPDRGVLTLSEAPGGIIVRLYPELHERSSFFDFDQEKLYKDAHVYTKRYREAIEIYKNLGAGI